jgi:hypothetical protein
MMGKFKGVVKFGFLVCTILVGISSKASSSINQFNLKVNKDSALLGEENFLGNWKYSADNVPYEYAQGILFISKKEGQLAVDVALLGGERKAQDVKVEANTLTFVLNLEGQLVTISFTVVGDKISGKASSKDGIFELKGERRLDPE